MQDNEKNRWPTEDEFSLKETPRSTMSEETKQALIIAICVFFTLTSVVLGIVMLNQLSNDYWQPIVKTCLERGGTFAHSTCYGVK